MPANPTPFEARQPDGKSVRLHIRGDEWFHWYEDTDGHTVVIDNGRYAYGQLDKDNRLIATPFTVGVDNPEVAGLKKRTLPPVETRRSLRPSLLSGSSESSAVPAAVPPSGTVKNLVVLCKFSDHTLGVHTRDPCDYDILFNQVGGDPTLAPTGSVKDLYIENSYNTMTLQSTVTVWVTLPSTEAYYADGEDGTGAYPRNAQKMVEDALDLVDPLVDFSEFDSDLDGYIDAIDIIHSGYGAETGGGGGNWIWSHRWSLWALPGGRWTSDDRNANNVRVKVYDYHTEPALWGTSGTNIVRFGVIAHETGHFFGLPDLYDTDGSGEGVGSWCMMANSWGFDYTQLHPPHFSAWSKIQLGWVTPTVINTPGPYTINQVETNPQVYRIDYGYPSSEYLLIENRQPVGIESAMPQGGLCIYHIDDLAGYNIEGYPGQAGWPDNGNHYRVSLLQADGDYDLEKNNNRGDGYDVYHAADISQIDTGPGNHPNTDAYQSGNIIITDNTLHSISAAGASMSFVYDNVPVPDPPVAQNGSASTQTNTFVSISLMATDDDLPNPPGVLNYIITSLPSHGSLSDPCAADINSVPYMLLDNGNQVIYTPDPEYTDTDSFQFKANDSGVPPNGGDSNVATISINIFSSLYFANMDTNPGWTLDSQWQWGAPTGAGGQYGEPDPTAGYTGTKVVGYNLSGDYANSISSTRLATTPAINCTNYTSVTLTFYRWLNVERSTYDHAYIEVSNDGTNWTTIWENPDSHIEDSSWTLQTFDISAIADNQPTVYIRWGMGTTDSSWQYSGWNIDDVEITGDIIIIPQHTLSISSTSGGHTEPNEGDHQFSNGTAVDINAIADAGYHFVNWTGSGVTAGKVANPDVNTTTITMDGDYNVTANFAIDTFTLDYAAGPGGSLTGDIAQVVDYNSTGTSVTAVPDIGYHFIDWSDASIDNPRTDSNVTVDVNVTANFAIDEMAIYGYITEPDANIPVDGVFIDANNGDDSEVTDANGYYQVTVDYGWSGTIEPNKIGHTFEPNGILYTNVTADQNDNYIAILDTFIISGYTVDSEMLTPLESVLLSPDNDGGPFTRKHYGGSDTTDVNGYYEVLVDYNWSGKVVPSKYAYAFEPNSIDYNNVTEDILDDQNYAGTLLTYTITGYIKNSCDVSIADVLVDANNGGGSDITDANGFYEVWVDYNWFGTVTPSKIHYTFDPNNKAYTNVIDDLIDQDYDANCIYDLDCDGSIGFGDVAVISENWLNGPNLPGDFYKDEDDIVNFLDFIDFANAWGD